MQNEIPPNIIVEIRHPVNNRSRDERCKRVRWQFDDYFRHVVRYGAINAVVVFFEEQRQLAIVRLDETKRCFHDRHVRTTYVSIALNVGERVIDDEHEDDRGDILKRLLIVFQAKKQQTEEDTDHNG